MSSVSPRRECHAECILHEGVWSDSQRRLPTKDDLTTCQPNLKVVSRPSSHCDPLRLKHGLAGPAGRFGIRSKHGPFHVIVPSRVKTSRLQVLRCKCCGQVFGPVWEAEQRLIVLTSLFSKVFCCDHVQEVQRYSAFPHSTSMIKVT